MLEAIGNVADGGAVDIRSIAGWTGLAAGLVTLSLFEGCSTTASEQGMSRAALSAAAMECASGKPALKVDRVDDDGQVHLTLLPGGHRDGTEFSACYSQKTAHTLTEGRAAAPAPLVASQSIMERSVGRPASRQASVKLRTVNNKFLVPVVLNDVQAATFLLDTGANSTVISPNLVRTLKLPPFPGEPKAKARMASGQEVEVSVVRLNTIAVGAARMNNFGAVVYDIPAVAGCAGPAIKIDGLLGTDFLAGFTMTLDPRAETLTFYLDGDVPAK